MLPFNINNVILPESIASGTSVVVISSISTFESDADAAHMASGIKPTVSDRKKIFIAAALLNTNSSIALKGVIPPGVDS